MSLYVTTETRRYKARQFLAAFLLTAAGWATATALTLRWLFRTEIER